MADVMKDIVDEQEPDVGVDEEVDEADLTEFDEIIEALRGQGFSDEEIQAALVDAMESGNDEEAEIEDEAGDEPEAEIDETDAPSDDVIDDNSNERTANIASILGGSRFR